jgi:hypothetical protein
LKQPWALGRNRFAVQGKRSDIDLEKARAAIHKQPMDPPSPVFENVDGRTDWNMGWLRLR